MHLSSRLLAKLRRRWGSKWPETPVPPDYQELRDALKRIHDLLRQQLDEQRVTSGLLREMKDQGANHHSEIHGILSEPSGLATISSDAHTIVDVLKAHRLQSNVHVAMTMEVDRLLRGLPQSIAEKKIEHRARHLRAASA